MQSLRVAVIGLGVGEQHARTFATTPGCQVTAVVDHDTDRARRLASELGTARAEASFEDVVDDPDVDVLSIASYDQDHAAQVEAGLRAGKHVFVEKPLCRTLPELERIHAAWARSGGRLHLASNLVLRAAPFYRWLRKSREDGDLGTIYAFDGDYLYGRLHKITHGWRRDVPDYSVMEGGGIHLLDIMLWTLGERPDSVVCDGNALCTQESGFRQDDHMTALFRFPSGTIGRVTSHFGAVHQHQHVVRAFGTRATVLLDDMGPRMHHHYDDHPDKGPVPLDLATGPTGKGALIPDFAAAIHADRDLSHETRLCFDGVAVAAACDTASRTQDRQKVRYL